MINKNLVKKLQGLLQCIVLKQKKIKKYVYRQQSFPIYDIVPFVTIFFQEYLYHLYNYWKYLNLFNTNTNNNLYNKYKFDL